MELPSFAYHNFGLKMLTKFSPVVWQASRSVFWPGIGRVFSSFSSLPSTIETCWQVSSCGRVCNTRGAVTFGTLLPSGYRRVNISGRGFLVHQLVVFAFRGPSPDATTLEVNHLDGNRSNNHLDNLERVTRSQNVQHSYDSGSRKCAGPKVSKPVMWRVEGSRNWTTSESVTQAAAQAGLSRSAVSKCCHASSLAKGFEFRFVDEKGETMQGEKWRQMLDPRSGREVPGRMVSSLGRVQFSNGRMSTGHLQRDGYCTAWITSAPGSRNEFVHRLVAIAFLGPPPTPHHTQINHKDGNKNNNAVSNLQYVTPAENVKHSCRLGLRNGNANAKPVESREHGSDNAWVPHSSIASAACALGVWSTNISSCIGGKYKHTGGFEFRLLERNGPDFFPGEKWLKVDVLGLARERRPRPRKLF